MITPKEREAERIRQEKEAEKAREAEETSEARLRRRVDKLEKTLKHLIIWMSSSANSPISQREATELIVMINKEIH